MITFYTNNKKYNNDLYNLGRAFYPTSEVKVKEYSENPNYSHENSHENNYDNSFNLTLILSLEEHNISVETFIKDEQSYKAKEEVESSNIKFYRNALKRLVYICLSKISGRTLKWGTLTGVRPTKIVLDMLEQEETDKAIRDFMQQQYYCSDEKIDLSLEVAKKELELLKKVDYTKGYSLYIGIPFCPTTCLYCSFASYPILKHQDTVDLYLEALMKEISFASTYITDKKLTSVYIGGGTPTSLSADQLERLLSYIEEVIDLSNIEEYTIEAGRPDSITYGKLKIMKDHNVSRISINPQSMSQKTLDLIGRNHSVEEVVQAFDLARQVGHDNINMDIIIGLPGETINDVEHTLKEIGKLEPDSLTVHALAIKRAARLNSHLDEYKDLKPENILEMRYLTEKYAKSSGYYPYYLYRQKNVIDNIENIGYAKPGKEGLYNVLMMEDKHNVLALGAGALSKFVSYDQGKIRRVENVKSLQDYIERIDDMIDRKSAFKQKYQ